MKRIQSLLVATALLAAGCTSSSDGESQAESTSEATATTTGASTTLPDAEDEDTAASRATIQRTSNNVPHISADSYANLGYGYGYAMAEDHMCTLADLAVQVRSQAAASFGEGPNAKWLNQDLVYASLGLQEMAEADLASADQELQDLMHGFADGINLYLDETGVDAVPGYCQGEDWVGPVEAVDIAAFARRLSWLSSVAPLTDFIAQASPPVAEPSAEETPSDEEALALFSDQLAASIAPAEEVGSNAWALGPDLTEDGTTMLAGNPHFPWQGSLRFYEAHLTITDELDVYGMSLLGSPIINIGFNENVAWSHTVSAGRRFTIYNMSLSSPTTYRYGDEEREMTSSEVTVRVKGDGGELQDVTRTLYSTHYGPVIDIPGIGWSATSTFSIRDANADNNEILGQFLAMSKAGSMEEFQEAHAIWQGVPWVNTIAASADGRIWYADTASTPNLSPEAISAWLTAREVNPLVKIVFDSGSYLLDGADPVYEWVDDPEARDPGVEPFSAKPQLERSDYVLNANDAYWLANSEEFTPQASPLHGLFESNVSPRTRAAVVAMQQNGGDDGLFSLVELQDSVLSNQALTAERVLDDFVPYCLANAPDPAPCEILGAWDRTVNLDAPGAPLWREFIASFSHAELIDAGPVYAVGFDPGNPIETPNTLVLSPELIDRLVAATENLQAAGLDLDSTLRQSQFAQRGDVKIAVHGGYQVEGVTNIVSPGGNDTTNEPSIDQGRVLDGSDALTENGYGVSSGGSFVYTLEFTDAGPQAFGFLTYGNAGDPASEFYSDQTQLFADKAWRALLFSAEAIASDPELREYRVG